MSNERFRPVTSKKPNRQGEAFIVRGNSFYLKVYKDAPGNDAKAIASKLCQLMNENIAFFDALATLEHWENQE